MNTDNLRQTQGLPNLESSGWRTQLQVEAREKIVVNVFEILKKHIPSTGEEALSKLKKIAIRFEKKIYASATSQNDYLRKICMKMVSVENNKANALQLNPDSNGGNPPGPASQSTQSHEHEQGQSLTNPTVNESEALQKLSPNIQNNSASAGFQTSSSSSTMPPVSTGLTQSPLPNGVGQNLNLLDISGSSHNSIGNSGGEKAPSNIIHDSQRLARSKQTSEQVDSKQHEKQSPNLQQQQVQHQLLEQKFMKGNITHSHMQTQTQQQQQQQRLLQPTQLSVNQISSDMQPPEMQSSSLSNTTWKLQTSVQHSKQSVLQQHPQSVLRQQQHPHKTSVTHQQKPMLHQPLLPSHKQQQQLLRQQPNATDIEQKLLTGNEIPDMRQRQQLLQSQQSSILKLQQQQDVLDHQNNSRAHQQQLGEKGNTSGLQQQHQLLGVQSDNSSKQSNRSSIHMLQQPKVTATTTTVTTTTVYQGQQARPQSEQLMLPQNQSKPGQFRQQLNPLPQNMQQRLQTSDSTSEKGREDIQDSQQEASQKVKRITEMYLPMLNERYKRVTAKLQQIDSLHPQIRNDSHEKLRAYKLHLERGINFLHVAKSKVPPAYLARLDDCEKWIINLINIDRPRTIVSSLQQGQLPPCDMRLLQQSLQPQSQIPVLKPHEDQRNPSHAINSQSSMTKMQQNDMSSFHQNLPVSAQVTSAQQNMRNLQQPGTNLDTKQGISMKSSQQVTTGPQQSSVSTPKQHNSNILLSPSDVKAIPLQSHSQVFQQIDLKQQKEQQLVRTQQQFQQQKQSKQFLTHEIPQHQMNGVNDKNVRQGSDVKSEVPLQCHSADKLSVYFNQQTKLPCTSPQLHQDESPKNPGSSPQIDPRNMPTSLTKTGPPFELPNSSHVVHSSTPLAPSYITIDSEKVISGALATELIDVVNTPGMSASPLLVEANNSGGDVSTITIGKSCVTEPPFERLINLVKTLSPKALNASVSDFESVISLGDKIAGLAPGNRSISEVGEELVTLPRCYLRGRNFGNDGGSTETRKRESYATAVPMAFVSLDGNINDRLEQLTDLEATNSESTTMSHIKRPRIEANYSLLKEIREINQRLIDTVVNISDEAVDSTAILGSEGTIVNCSFNSVSVSPTMVSQNTSLQTSLIRPLRLLVPSNYPNCSPIFLDKLPMQVSESEDLSVKAKAMLCSSLLSLKQPMSLGEIAKSWDICARSVICEYAQQFGGGTFSSKYGTWEDCPNAA